MAPNKKQNKNQKKTQKKQRGGDGIIEDIMKRADDFKNSATSALGLGSSSSAPAVAPAPAATTSAKSGFDFFGLFNSKAEVAKPAEVAEVAEEPKPLIGGKKKQNKSKKNRVTKK